ncbi:HAMP domain-containing sensor histidine kinase [Paenibacillus sp. L3-i20]|uniref:sensor histidine kinase n=1 Tax=Paenibacillus sp. L3-i20 TaxID=2905833 RepID=UPI001EDF71C0|nr:sensor histidine kinase [Paenibacillus sp. L3-i20]GKU76034.1 sensor histidine kinase [Paenibacillus sp. L3-i20]
MRLFFREHVPLTLFMFVQLGIVTLVFYLDGYRSWTVAAYAILLGICLFAVYLIYRYMSHRKLYELLSRKTFKIEESYQLEGHAPLPASVNELLNSQYRHYENELVNGERSWQNHITFMNQWVHQMKTPLSVLELMLQDDDGPRNESMLEETERLRKGLEMILYMARLETFEVDFGVDKVILRHLANEVILENKRLFIRNYVYPRIEIEEDLVVETDHKWLRFILIQIISNAVKFAAGTESIITIAAYHDERGVILEVRDKGVGIPAFDMKRIFQPFFTGENGRRFKESSGMGLYMAKTVMDKMNQKIEAESKVGEGTIIRLIFPYAAVGKARDH